MNKQISVSPVGVYEGGRYGGGGGGGHRSLILRRAVCRFRELKALLASTSRTASVLSFANDSLIAWTTAPPPHTAQHKVELSQLRPEYPLG